MWTRSDPFGDWHIVVKEGPAIPRRSSPAFHTACGLVFLIPPKDSLDEGDHPCPKCEASEAGKAASSLELEPIDE